MGSYRPGGNQIGYRPWKQQGTAPEAISAKHHTNIIAQPVQKANPRNKLQTANKPSDLKIFLPNIQRGLQSKLDKLNFELNKTNPHIGSTH